MRDNLSRRRVLTGVAAAGLTAVAGCAGPGEEEGTPAADGGAEGEQTPAEEAPGEETPADGGMVGDEQTPTDGMTDNETQQPTTTEQTPTANETDGGLL